MTLVFTYGTLKRGFANHQAVMAKEGREDWFKFRGYARTVEAFPMFVDAYRIPYLANHRGRGQQVAGELFEVSDEGLAVLDEIEGVPTRYSREQIDVHLDGAADGHPATTTRAWLYMLNNTVPYFETREFIADYTMEVHAAFVKRGERDMSRLQAWGGFE